MPLPAYLTAGTFYCVGRPKVAYPTWWQARLRTLYAATEMGVFLDEYECRYCGGWHVFGVTKEVSYQVAYGTASDGGPSYYAELIAAARYLKVLAGRGVVVPGKSSSGDGLPPSGGPGVATGRAPAPLQGVDLEARQAALRRFNRALAVALPRVPRKDGADRHRFKRRVRTRRRRGRQPRTYLPRSAAVSYGNGKMLARYDPEKKIWGEWSDFTGKLQPRDAPVIRRLHRHRERELVRKLIREETRDDT